jgi:V/A-type H+-transporting ATPase subunit K
MVEGLGDMSISLALAAVGSALGTGVAAMSAVGAWKKAFTQDMAARFALVAFVGAPLTQTIYGVIVRNSIQSANLAPESYWFQLILGGLAGLGMGMSAYMQGKTAAKACDAYQETGKGFANYLMVIGIVETVALFVMVFTMMALP